MKGKFLCVNVHVGFELFSDRSSLQLLVQKGKDLQQIKLVNIYLDENESLNATNRYDNGLMIRFVLCDYWQLKYFGESDWKTKASS